MIRFGKSMGLYVVAEGVETEEQFQLLEKMGVDAVQGYYISAPVNADPITVFKIKNGVPLNAEALRFYVVFPIFLLIVVRKTSWIITSAKTSPIAISTRNHKSTRWQMKWPLNNHFQQYGASHYRPSPPEQAE